MGEKKTYCPTYLTGLSSRMWDFSLSQLFLPVTSTPTRHRQLETRNDEIIFTISSFYKYGQRPLISTSKIHLVGTFSCSRTTEILRWTMFTSFKGNNIAFWTFWCGNHLQHVLDQNFSLKYSEGRCIRS